MSSQQSYDPTHRSTHFTTHRKRKKRKSFLYKYRRVFYLGAGCLLLLVLCIYPFFKSSHYTNALNLQTHHLDKKELSKLSIDSITKRLSPSELEDPSVRLLIENSSSYPLAKEILMQLDAYPASLITLAAKKTETIDFVAQYPSYMAEASHPNISLDDDYTPGHIPLLLQWDKRWGYEKYGDDLIAVNGCGPTCLSMIAISLTGDTSLNPKVVADLSYDEGYFTECGTSWSLMTEGAKKLGLDGEMIAAHPPTIRQALKDGIPIIASMRPGHFTTEGHFIVLYAIDDEDNISVNDPDSLLRSDQAWPLSLILDECKCLWQFNSP